MLCLTKIRTSSRRSARFYKCVSKTRFGLDGICNFHFSKSRRLGVCLARAAFGAAARPFCPHPLLGESRGQSPLPPPPPPPPPPFEGASSPPPLRRRCVAFRPTHSARNRFSGPPCRRPRPHGGKQACKTARAKMATVIAHSKHNATHARTHAHAHAHARARARAHTRRRTRARTHAHSRTQK